MWTTLHKLGSLACISHCRPPLKPCVAAAARSPACQWRTIRLSSQSAICQTTPPDSVPQQEEIVKALRWCGFCETHRLLRHFQASASRDGSVINYAPYCGGCTFRNSKLRDLVYWQGMDLARAEVEVVRIIDSQPDRQCSCCKEQLPAGFFPISASPKQCRSCLNEKGRNRQRIVHPAADTKKCTKCGKTLPGSSFSPGQRGVGIGGHCRDCWKLRARDGRARIKSVPHVKSTLPSSHTCSRCGQDKPLSAFTTDSGSTIGVLSSCKMCNKAKERQKRLDKKA